MRNLISILICLPMIGFCQTDLTGLLFQLIDAKDTRIILESENWSTNSVNNQIDEYDINYDVFKFSKYINYENGSYSICYITTKEYNNYSNVITLKFYEKSFYNKFKNIIVNSNYEKTSQNVEYNTIESVYAKDPLKIVFKEDLNNYYEITLLNYNHINQKAQAFEKTKLKAMAERDKFKDIESNEEEISGDIYMVVEEMPLYGECKDVSCSQLEIMRYISKNVIYPSDAKERNITGRVFVSFIIDELGYVTNVKILRGVDKSLDLEALRVVKSMPKFKPGKQRGKFVRVQYNIPISFKLN